MKKYVSIAAGVFTGVLLTSLLGISVVHAADWWELSGIHIYNSNSGRVGIKTSTPISDMEVYNDSSLTGTGPGLTISQDGSGDALLHFNLVDTTQWVMGIDNSDSDTLKIASSTDLGTDTAVTFTDEGRLGVGATNPNAPLDVRGGSDATLSSGGFLNIGALSTTNLVLDSDGIMARNDSSTSNLHLQNYGGNIKIHGDSGDTTEQILILDDGTVGIGEVNGTYLTHKLNVKGDIKAQAILVTEAANQWSDYVFAPDYTLQPLAELGEYIDTHGHLPDIPTTEQVRVQGIDLGEMDGKLLAKIEELTLYILELEERITTLETQGR